MEDYKIKELQNNYNNMIKKILNITTKEEMFEFCARKTISSTMLDSTRLNETKVLDAIKGSNYVEGDRCYVFYLPDDSLCLAENFKGEYNKIRLLKNLFDTITIFEDVVDMTLFPNYALKRNQKLLDNL